MRTARGRKGLDTRAPQPRPRIYNIQSDGRAGAAQVAAYVRCPSSRPRPRPGEVNYQKIASFHAGVHPQLITTTQDSTQPRFSLTLRLSYYYLLCSFIHSLIIPPPCDRVGGCGDHEKQGGQARNVGLLFLFPLQLLLYYRPFD